MSDILNQLKERARRAPDKVAIWEDRGKGFFRRVTRGELLLMSEAFQREFERSTSPDSMIPIYLERTAECVAAILGAIAASRCFVPINRKLRAPQVECIVQLLASPYVLSDAGGLMQLKPSLIPGTPLATTQWKLLPSNGSNRMADLPAILKQELVIDDFDVSAEKRFEGGGGSGDENNPGCCLFTSGSTGEPKGVLIGSDDLCGRVAAEVDWYRVTESDVLLNLLPFSFDVGLNQMLSAVHAGAELVLLHSWMPVDIRRACQKLAVTGISSVPGLWRDQISSGIQLTSGAEGGSLRYITVSGGGLDTLSLERLPRLVPGAGIYKTYGQTETFRTSSLHPDEYQMKPESVGRAFGSARFHIVDDQMLPCAPLQDGEIFHTGLGVMRGYLRGGHSGTKLIENPFLATGDLAKTAIRTGDFGYVDDKGFLFVRGRKDEMIKIQDNRVYPDEIAAQTVLVEGVCGAEVVGFRMLDGTTKLAAFLQIDKNSSLTAVGIRAELRKKLPSYMIPSLIEVCEIYPKTSNGKTDRQRLVQLAGELTFSLENQEFEKI